MQDNPSQGGPHESGSVIATLVRGDEIKIQPGYSSIPANEPRLVIISAVSGWSALCADGTMLACNDGEGVERTGKHLEDFEETEEVRRILAELASVN